MLTAWKLYVGEYEDKLPPNAKHIQDPRGWINGFLDFRPNNRDNTNVLYLIGSKKVMGDFYPKLGLYTQTAGIYKCPSDSYTAKIGKKHLPRVRSVSMNGFIEGGLYDPTMNMNNSSIHGRGWRKYDTLAHIIDPSRPSSGFLPMNTRTASITAASCCTPSPLSFGETSRPTTITAAVVTPSRMAMLRQKMDDPPQG